MERLCPPISNHLLTDLSFSRRRQRPAAEFTLTVHFANARHCYSADGKILSADCFNELRVEALMSVPASNSFEEYRSGREAESEVILDDFKGSSFSLKGDARIPIQAHAESRAPDSA